MNTHIYSFDPARRRACLGLGPRGWRTPRAALDTGYVVFRVQLRGVPDLQLLVSKRVRKIQFKFNQLVPVVRGTYKR